MTLQATRCDWIDLGHDRDKWGFLVNMVKNLIFIGPCIILIVEERKTNLMSLAILFHFLCAQHVLQPAKRTTQNQPHQISNTQWTENKTTDVVIQQHSRKLLMMDILMSETCWAHKTWNKIASDIKLVFHSYTITTLHGPINIRLSESLVVINGSEEMGIQWNCLSAAYTKKKSLVRLGQKRCTQLKSGDKNSV